MNSPAPSRQIDRHAREANRGAARASAIVAGLMRTRRARKVSAIADDAAEFLRLERRTAPGAYWVKRDGSEIRAGASFADAADLQPGFVAAMERAGAE